MPEGACSPSSESRRRAETLKPGLGRPMKRHTSCAHARCTRRSERRWPRRNQARAALPTDLAAAARGPAADRRRLRPGPGPRGLRRVPPALARSCRRSCACCRPQAGAASVEPTGSRGPHGRPASDPRGRRVRRHARARRPERLRGAARRAPRKRSAAASASCRSARPRSSATAQESERQRAEILNAARNEARELLANAQPRRDAASSARPRRAAPGCSSRRATRRPS